MSSGIHEYIVVLVMEVRVDKSILEIILNVLLASLVRPILSHRDVIKLCV